MRDDDKPDILTRLRLRKLRDRLKTLPVSERPDWLRRAQERVGLSAVNPVLFLVLAVTFAVVALTLFVGFYVVLWQMIFQDPPEGQEAVWNWRFSIAQLVAVTTVLGAVIALPITLNRLVLTRRQTEAAEKDHLNSVQGHITDRINKAVLGLGEDKERNWVGNSVTIFKEDEDGNKVYSRTVPLSVEDTLSLEDREKVTGTGNSQVFTETYPNLEVRIGAIFALERIAQDSDRDHVQIMEILCAYIRQNAPAPTEDDWPELEMKDSENDGPLEADWKERLKAFEQAQDEAKKNEKPREDIQTALTVIGRRSPRQRRLEAGRGVEAPFPFDVPCPDYDVPDEVHDPEALHAWREDLQAWKRELEAYEGYRLDLRGADLRGADLAERELKGAKLDGAYLQGADLVEAQLQGVDLLGARLQGAYLRKAQVQGADLWSGLLKGADLWGVRLQGANLVEAQLQGAGLTMARLQEADLWGSQLQGAGLRHAQLQGAELTGVQLQGAGLRQAQLQGAELEEAQLQGADLGGTRFDGNTLLTAAVFRGAAVKRADFTNIPQIAEHVPDMFGDASVTLPGGHGPGHETWPPHWPKFDLGFAFYKEWRKWQADPKDYRPPDPPKPDDTA